MPAADLGDGGGVAEVDYLRLVREREAGRVGVPVDRDDPRAELAHALDRAPLVASRADEEDRARHGRDATEEPLRLEKAPLAVPSSGRVVSHVSV